MQDIETGSLIQNNKKHRTWSSTGVDDSTKYEEASTGSRGFFFPKLSQAQNIKTNDFTYEPSLTQTSPLFTIRVLS